MTMDALRGKGAYRCGCGARVFVTVPAPTTGNKCSWKNCRTIAVADSDVPLCVDHARRLRVQLGISRDSEHQIELWRRTVMEDRDFEDDIDAAADKQRAENAEKRLRGDPYNVRAPEPTWCYFMRHETNIKIGYSKDPRKRALALAGAEILAKEPGAASRESQLHEQFAHLRLHGEWFEPGPDLLEYIAKLRQQAGLGPIPETSRQLRAKRLKEAKRAVSKRST